MLHYAVSLRVVGSCGGNVDSEVGERCLPRGGSELSTSVGGDSERDSESWYPGPQECLQDRFCHRVHDWHGCGPTRSPINHCQEVFVALVGGEWAHNINMDMCEAFMRHPDREDGRHRVSGNLARQACLALPGPKEDVAAHATPGVGLGDDGQGRFSR